MTGFETVNEQNKSFIVMISPAVQIAQIESSKEYMKKMTHCNNLFWIQVKEIRIDLPATKQIDLYGLIP